MKTKLLFYGELIPRVTGISYMNEVFLKTLIELYQDKIEIKKIRIKHSQISIIQFFLRIKEILQQLYYLKNKNIYFSIYNFNKISLLNLYIIKVFSFLFNKNIDLYVQIHRVDFDTIKNTKFTYYILKKYNVIVLNEFQKKYLIDYGIESTIIRNTLFDETIFIKDVINDTINFTFLSNYLESKGIIILLNTFKKISNKSIHLNTYGNFLDQNIQKEYLKKYESKYVKINENINEDEKQHVFKNTSCFILPSLKTEAQSILVIEAMFQGIPIIVSNVGTISDMLGENYELLVNDISEENLLITINKFLSYDNIKKKEISEYLKNRYYLLFSKVKYIENIKRTFYPRNSLLLYSSFSNIKTGQSIISNQVLKILSNNYKVLVIDTYKHNNIFFNLLNTIYSTFKFVFFYTYDGIYITASRSKFGFYKDFFFLNILKKKDILIYNHIHGINFINKNDSFFRNYLLKIFFNKTHNVLLHKSFINEYSKFSNFKYSILENYIDPVFENFNKTFNSTALTIYYPSNIIYSKGIFIFLEVAERLLKINNTFKFIIAGDFFGDMYCNKYNIRKEFFKKINSLNKQFPGNVNYVGLIHSTDKINFYEESSIVLFPTFYNIEAFPLVGLESFGSKCILLTNNHNYLKEVYSKYKVVYTNNNPISYVNAILEISNNINHYKSMVDFNYNLVFSENDINTFNNKIIKLFLN